MALIVKAGTAILITMSALMVPRIAPPLVVMKAPIVKAAIATRLVMSAVMAQTVQVVAGVLIVPAGIVTPIGMDRIPTLVPMVRMVRLVVMVLIV